MISWFQLSICANIFFILPDISSNTSCPSQPCATLSQYVLDYNGTLPVLSNVRYHLLSGEHCVPQNLKLDGLYNFTLIGRTDKYSPPVVIKSCLGLFITITDDDYLVISNVVFKQCKSIQQYNGSITNLYIGYCWSCTVENVTFLEYGLMGLNIYGGSVLNNVVFNLTITSSRTYLDYHALVLAYKKLPDGNNEDSMVCTLKGVYISGHGNKYLPNELFLKNVLRAIIVSVLHINYHFKLEIKNSHFYDIDQSVMNIRSLNPESNTTVLIENCIFEYIGYNHTVIPRVALVDLSLVSASTVLLLSGCTFQYIAKWISTINIDLEMLRLSKHPAAEVYITFCTFFGNLNPVIRA